MQTIGHKLDIQNGIGPGFDFLRLFLAVSVLLNHSFLLTAGNYDFVDSNGLWAYFGAIIPLFFALSGFLITGSAQRLKLKDFMLNRGLRIIPALLVDIVFCAIILGPIITTLPLSEYFSEKEFKHYFLNIIGFIQYELPGVFEQNPFPKTINGSLWTVSYEIGCYVLMAFMMMTGIIKYKQLMLLLFFLTLVLSIPLNHIFDIHLSNLDGPLWAYLSNFISPRGNHLYLYFMGGCVLYIYRQYVPHSNFLAAIFLLLVLLCGAKILDLGTYKHIVLSLPISYLAAYIGSIKMPKLPIFSRGDYSYGIYLYGYPLQQLLVHIFSYQISVMTHFALSFVLVTIFAMFSWHVIERPILSLRRKFSFTARKNST